MPPSSRTLSRRSGRRLYLFVFKSINPIIEKCTAPEIVETCVNRPRGYFGHEKYLHFIHDRYFKMEDMDLVNQWLFTFAAYNAGPAKVRRLRKETSSMGLDPNIWFKNVELAAAKRIGRETVQYVGNIYKYYIAYHMIREKLELKSRNQPSTR